MKGGSPMNTEELTEDDKSEITEELKELFL